MQTINLPISRRIISFSIGIIGLLAIPFVAMRFTTEVNWSIFDFAVMGFLLVLLTSGLALCLRIFKTGTQRVIALSASFVIFLLIWIELAVGIFGSPLAGS